MPFSSGQNLSLFLGDSFSETLTATGYNLTGAWTGEAGVRYRYGSTGYALNFNYSGITADTFTISVNPTGTTGLAVGDHPYNVKISSGNITNTIYYGYLSVYPNIIH